MPLPSCDRADYRTCPHAIQHEVRLGTVETRQSRLEGILISVLLTALGGLCTSCGTLALMLLNRKGG
jgi:hypothetical protein